MTQVLTQIIDFKRDISTAVNAPRLHWDGQMLQVEPGFARDAIAELVERFPVNVWKERNVYFGGVHTVIPGGDCVGDPRRGGGDFPGHLRAGQAAVPGRAFRGAAESTMDSNVANLVTSDLPDFTG